MNQHNNTTSPPETVRSTMPPHSSSSLSAPSRHHHHHFHHQKKYHDSISRRNHHHHNHHPISNDLQQQQQQQQHQQKQQHWVVQIVVAGLKKGFLFKLILLVLASIGCVHRVYAQYEQNRVFVHPPIHTLPRTCPEPTYTTLSSAMSARGRNIENNDSANENNNDKPKICLTTLTDEREHSVLQRFVRWRNFDGLLKMTWDNKQQYADQYGYYLFDESSNFDTSRPPSWSKIKAAKRLLMEENCTWVWWVDADTVIMNSHKRIEDFLPAPDAPQDLLLSQDHAGGYNAGGWLIRNSPYALEFLDEWWNMKQYIKPFGLAKSGDNDAFKAMLATLPEFDQHILVPPRCTFNSFAYFVTEDHLEGILAAPEGSAGSLKNQFWYQNEAFYHKGDLLAHVAGYNNKEQPVSMLLDIAE